MRIRTHANPLSCTQHFEKMNIHELFPEPTGGLDFEIGFGQSSFIINYAQANPYRAIVGIEVRKKTVDLMQEKVEKEKLKNIHLILGNGQTCLNDFFHNQSLDTIFIFHPDPWIKRRHNNRRLINREFLEIAQEKIKPGGKIHIATDVDILWNEILIIFSAFSRFSQLPNDSFWEHYSGRWHEISQKKGKRTFHMTFILD